MAKNKNTENNQEDLLKQQENTTPPNQEGENQDNGQDISLQQGSENDNKQGSTTPPNQEGEDGNNKENGQVHIAVNIPTVEQARAAFFEKNPQAKKYFETADGRKFFNAHDARNHANTLRNKSVHEINK